VSQWVSEWVSDWVTDGPDSREALASKNKIRGKTKLGGPPCPRGVPSFRGFFPEKKCSKLPAMKRNLIGPNLNPDTCTEKFQLVSMGASSEGLACADPGARAPIGASGNFHYFFGRVWVLLRRLCGGGGWLENWRLKLISARLELAWWGWAWQYPMLEQCQSLRYVVWN
jgi:hypothetical protein